MARITAVGEGIFQISPPEGVRVSTCSSYLVVGDRSAIVETGPAVMAKHILEGLKEIGHGPSSVAYVIPTHIHLDHGGGVGYMMERLPGARLVVHERGAPHVVDPTKLIASTKTVFGDEFEKTAGPILPVAGERVWAVKGGEEIDLGGRRLSIYYTPGHAPHHISILDSATHGIFSGEALGTHRGGSENVYPSVAPPSFSEEDFRASVKKIVSLAPSVVYFSHDGPATGVDELAHKVERSLSRFSELVLSAMREGADRAEVARRVKALYAEYAEKSSNPAVERFTPGSDTLTDGFMMYFKRKELV